jgi:hypothetical protein
VYIIGCGDKKNQIINFKSPIDMAPFQKEGDKKRVLISQVAKYLWIKPQNTDKLEIIKID